MLCKHLLQQALLVLGATTAFAQKAELSQQKTNGNSVLGTNEAPVLPEFLTNNPTPNGFPWNKRNIYTDYYRDYPNTGVVRKYNFSIKRGTIAPDGYSISGILVNGAFPGPTIEANWGDTIEVTVHNKLEDEGFAMHWHGFIQKGTPYEDGSPAITQCPIPPGKSYTYRFRASLYGTTWYHSHYSAQYAAGALGPMVIHGPKNPKDNYIDLGPVMLSDWYHQEYFDLVKQVMAPNAGPPPRSINNLINGKNNFNCSSLPAGNTVPCNSNAGLAKLFFRKGQTHRLRLINAGAEALQRFSIDGHTMTVIANDFVPIKPYDTKVVTLGIGQRADVLVKANGNLDAYWIRANISEPCSLTDQPNAKGIIYYGKDTGKEPKSQAWPIADPRTCANDDLNKTVPIYVEKLPKTDKIYHMDIDAFQNASQINLFSLDDVSFRGNYNYPTLLLSKLNNLTFEEEWNVRNVGDAKSVVLNITNPIYTAGFSASHPMHMHGFNMKILHEGPGVWDGTVINPNNPLRRDTIQLRPEGHIAVQFDAAENPGVWPFHCHIAWHVSSGLFVQFLTNPKKVTQLDIPQTVAQTCREWGNWTNTNIPNQIDSGL